MVPSSAEIAAPAVFRLFNGEWDQVQVVQVADAKHAQYEQRSIAELAKEAGADPLDFMFDLALAENLDTVFTATLLNSDEDAVGRMLNHPNSVVSLSDAGAHNTVARLLPAELRDSGWAREVLSFRPSVCHVALYLGLEGDIAANGASASMSVTTSITTGRSALSACASVSSVSGFASFT